MSNSDNFKSDDSLSTFIRLLHVHPSTFLWNERHFCCFAQIKGINRNKITRKAVLITELKYTQPSFAHVLSTSTLSYERPKKASV